MSELTGTRWLIIADDLTGAADAAVAFAQRSTDCRVLCGETSPNPPDADVLACTLDSRGADVATAIERSEAVLLRYGHSDRRLFKKIDSILRGHPGEEIAAALRFRSRHSGRAFGLLAPAFPATGRTTINGHVHVNGRPLEPAPEGEHGIASSDLVEVLARARLRGAVIPIEVVRDCVALERALRHHQHRGDVAICDAMEQTDLEKIARIGLAIEETVFIGSAGLARAIASLTTAEKNPALSIAHRTTPVLTIIGSQASASHGAVRRLAHDPMVFSVALDERSFAPPAALHTEHRIRAAADALRAGRDVLIYMEPSSEPQLSIGARVAHNLAAMTTSLLPHAGSLIASGGDTATALFAHAGVHSLRLLDEFEPGISLGMTAGDVSIPVITKSGSFGDEECLLRIAHHLHMLSDT